MTVPPRPLDEILRRARDRAPLVLDLIGPDRTGQALGLPAAVAAALAGGPPAVRRRLGRLAARRLGIDPTRLGEVDLYGRPAEAVIQQAAYLCGVSLALAARAGVLLRADYQAFADEFGAPQAAFALKQRARLRGGEGSAAAHSIPTIEASGATALVTGLRDGDHPLAPVAALILDTKPGAGATDPALSRLAADAIEAAASLLPAEGP